MFLGIGNAYENGFINWGVLENTADGLKYQVRKTPFARSSNSCIK
jgi:hypothetical protein